MPSSEELKKQNVASVARQRLRREFRSASKMLDKMGAGEEAQDRLRESFEQKKGQVYDTALNYKPSDNNEGISTATNDTFGNDFFSFDPEVAAAGGGGGGGLPEYPGDAPSDEIKAPLVWDDDNGEARWLQGETQDPADTNDYIDVFSYDPLPAFDKFSLTRFELRDGVICENGSPVNVKIMLIETP